MLGLTVTLSWLTDKLEQNRAIVNVICYTCFCHYERQNVAYCSELYLCMFVCRHACVSCILYVCICMNICALVQLRFCFFFLYLNVLYANSSSCNCMCGCVCKLETLAALFVCHAWITYKDK